LEEARERVSEKAQQLQHAERSWDEALNKSKDASATLVQDREARLVKANQDLEETKKDLELAREEAAAIAAELHREQEALSVSRARTSELHTLGVDMERELTAMLKEKEQAEAARELAEEEWRAKTAERDGQIKRLEGRLVEAERAQ
ncbi:unnamed protein product, partial [Ectocarpus sp. 12 AP-2014]